MKFNFLNKLDKDIIMMCGVCILFVALIDNFVEGTLDGSFKDCVIHVFGTWLGHGAMFLTGIAFAYQMDDFDD